MGKDEMALTAAVYYTTNAKQLHTTQYNTIQSRYNTILYYYKKRQTENNAMQFNGGERKK